jgi:hypothetical protein
MNRFRKEYNKLAQRINKVAQKGPDAVFEYYELIDEVLEKGQYSLLEEIMIARYGIDIRSVRTMEDFKKESFPDIRRVTNSNSSLFLKQVTDDKGVYSVGQHYYRLSNNQYIGDIREVESNTRFTEKKLVEIFVNLEVVVGLTSSILDAIPIFPVYPPQTLRVLEQSQFIYEGKIYHCTQSYTFSAINQITPTFSAYWAQVSAPIYSLISYTGSNVTLLNKYKLAIDTLKSYNYTIL